MLSTTSRPAHRSLVGPVGGRRNRQPSRSSLAHSLARPELGAIHASAEHRQPSFHARRSANPIRPEAFRPTHHQRLHLEPLQQAASAPRDHAPTPGASRSPAGGWPFHRLPRRTPRPARPRASDAEHPGEASFPPPRAHRPRTRSKGREVAARCRVQWVIRSKSERWAVPLAVGPLDRPTCRSFLYSGRPPRSTSPEPPGLAGLLLSALLPWWGLCPCTPKPCRSPLPCGNLMPLTPASVPMAMQGRGVCGRPRVADELQPLSRPVQESPAFDLPERLQRQMPGRLTGAAAGPPNPFRCGDHPTLPCAVYQLPSIQNRTRPFTACRSLWPGRRKPGASAMVDQQMARGPNAG